MQKYKSRKDVPDKYKWDLKAFFKSNEEFDSTYKKCKKDIAKIKNYIGCTKDANKLYEFLKYDTETESVTEDLYAYAYLINDEVLGVSENMSRKSKTEDLMNEYFLNVSFFNPELLELNKKEYDQLFKDNKKLLEFKPTLDHIYRNKDHILSEREEQIVTELCSAMDHFDDLSSTMLNSEHNYGSVTINGEQEQITPTNLRILMKNEDQELRKEIRSKYNETLGRYGATSASLLNSYVKGNIANCKIHHYESAWDAKLFGSNMPNEAFASLVNTVENNTDVLQKYYRLFKKELGLKELHQYDLNLELAKSKKEYSIEEAQELTLNAVKPLGEKYVKHFQKIFDNHYIDYAQYPKKCSGGYSFSTMRQDSRILMSYNYDLDSVSTMIHEGGHNVHHQLVSENNAIQNRYVPNIMAEVASLTNECLLSNYLAKHGKTITEKKAGIANILEVIISNLFGAVREGKIEQDFYKYVEDGNAITKDYMNDLTYKSLEKYYGKEVILDEYSKYSWMRRSHYYMNFYLYSYAICISVASFIANEIIKGNKEILDKYMKYLSTGYDVWAIDAFKILDVDLTKEDVYKSAIEYFDSLINEYEKLTKEGEK